MCRKCNSLMNQINEGKYTGREILFTGAVLFLSGASETSGDWKL